MVTCAYILPAESAEKSSLLWEPEITLAALAAVGVTRSRLSSASGLPLVEEGQAKRLTVVGNAAVSCA
jgi:hypothetical protein